MLSSAVLLILLNKPACNKKTHGQLWPDAANRDRSALLTLARSGTLEMCASAGWRYKWERVSLNVQLARKK